MCHHGTATWQHWGNHFTPYNHYSFPPSPEEDAKECLQYCLLLHLSFCEPVGTVWHAGCSISKEEAPAHTHCLFSLLSRHFPPCLATFAIPLTTLQLDSVEPMYVIFLFYTHLDQVMSTFKYIDMHSSNCLQTYLYIYKKLNSPVLYLNAQAAPPC